MSLLKKLRYVPKHFGIVAAFAAAVLVPAALMAWGPDRATFTTANPAPYVTFNSITDNPAYGDERNFMRVKPADAPDSAYSDNTKLVAGKEYEVYIYFHNNAAANLNLVANNTSVQMQLPAVVNGNTQSVAYINSPDAKPTKIWDETTLTSDSAMALRMVPGSAKIHSKGAVNGKTLPDSIITSGAPLGYNALDGKVPGCNQFAGYVTYKFKADQPNFTVQKEVSKHGENKWVESYAAQPGEKVDYLLQYKNTGTVLQKDVMIKDALPAGMTYVPGSAVLGNPANPAGVKTNDGVTTTGLNVGVYNPGQNAWIIFSATAPSKDKLVCGPNTLVNKQTVETDNGSKSDTANVTVNKECAPTPKYTCDALNVTPISKTQFTFEAKRTVENATYVRTTFVIRDAAGKELARVNDADGVYTYTQATAGKYSVEAQVIVSVNGVEKVAPGNCKKEFEVDKEVVKNVYECVNLEKITKSRDSYEFKTTARAQGNVTIKEVKVDFGDGQSAVVDYGKNAAHTYKPGNYTAQAYVTFTVDGKTVSGVTSEGCKVNVTVEKAPEAECKPGIPVNDDRCKETPETPETPEVLPSTGPEALVGGLFGSSALGLGIHSWLSSRRALRDATRR